MAKTEFKIKSGKSYLEKLSGQLAKLNTAKYEADDRFWYPEVDKSGNGYAVIRFLPEPPNEDVPFVRVWEHSFQGPTGQWYIEKSLSTIGLDDPVFEYTGRLWNTGKDEDKELARKYKRKQNFISNILVVKDQARPENDGKVFLFRYGKKIYNKLNDAMNPPKEFEDEQPVNPFDPIEGANLKLKIRNVEGYRNYDKSEFDRPSPISEDEEELKTVLKQARSLQEFVDPASFKSYDELKARLVKVLGTPGQREVPATAVKAPSVVEPDEVEVDDEEELDDLEKKSRFFKELAKE